MMDSASVSRSAHRGALQDRNAELVGQLRAAAMAGDDAHIRRLLSELLRCQGLTRGQRVSLQLKALLNLVQSLRCIALTDELTGLYNTRGFVQIGTRLLDVASRDAQCAHLIYFQVTELERINAAIGRSAGEVLVRQMGNFMRDLFPSYGVYEVLGRLSGAEFAALTTSAEYAARNSIMLRARRPPGRAGDLPALALNVGIAHFSPQRPVGIDELLANAKLALQPQQRANGIASSEITPHTGDASLNGLEAR